MNENPRDFYSGSDVQYFFDVNKNRLFTRNDKNYINRLDRSDLNTLGNYSLLDIYLSNHHIIEPHYHQNASELVYCIKGSVEISLINPFTQEQNSHTILPGQVFNIPQGWWHWESALEDDIHLLAIFDAPFPEYVLGSDILTKTPPAIFEKTYCINPDLYHQAIAPIQGQTIIIGPTDECLEQKQNARNRPFPSHPAAINHTNADHTATERQGGPVYYYPPFRNNSLNRE